MNYNQLLSSAINDNCADVLELVAKSVIVTRRPDGTGLSQHYVGLTETLNGLDLFSTIYFDECNGYQKILDYFDTGRYCSLIFTEAFYSFFSPESIDHIRKKYKIKVGLIFAWDSELLDSSDVSAINICVDVLLTVCESYREKWARQLNENIEVEYFKLPFSILEYEAARYVREEKLFLEKYKKDSVRLLTIGSYHPRKNHDITIKAAANLINAGHDVRLRIHSNIDQGEYSAIKQLGNLLMGNKFEATLGDLDEEEVLSLYTESHIYVSSSQGEGCNISLRHALASGMRSVFAAIPGHSDISDIDIVGIKILENLDSVSASYPERQNKVFGVQWKPRVEDVRDAIDDLICHSGASDFNAELISAVVADHEVSRSKTRIWRLLTGIGLITTMHKYESRKQGDCLPLRSVLVVPARDAGFFSIFNNYFSHLMYWKGEYLFDAVVPCWSVEAVMLTDQKKGSFTSYCYSRQNENLFDLLGGVDNFEKFNKDEVIVYSSGKSHNAKIEPNLTYVHAEKKFKSASFSKWRRDINRLIDDHFNFNDEILEILSSIRLSVDNYDRKLSILVRPASHAIEQADSTIAGYDDYLRVASEWYEDTKSKHQSACILLASDQEYVVNLFKNRFEGDVYFTNFNRVSVEYYNYERSLSADQAIREGHQLQHQLARNPENFSIENAEFVVADALMLSMGDEMIHVTSNIATAVSCINPGLACYHIHLGDSLYTIKLRALLNQVYSY